MIYLIECNLCSLAEWVKRMTHDQCVIDIGSIEFKNECMDCILLFLCLQVARKSSVKNDLYLHNYNLLA